MTLRPALVWPDAWSDGLAADVHALIAAVTELGGAIGWLQPPPRAETDAWLCDVLGAVAAGDGALCTVRVANALAAMATWRRGRSPVFARSGEVAKIMVGPGHRGLGLGSAVLGALIDHASRSGIEILTLGVRGNNHLAIELYEALGFREWGRLPNVIAVGEQRFDDVRMYLELGRPEGVVLRGGKPGGPGSSPARRPVG